MKEYLFYVKNKNYLNGNTNLSSTASNMNTSVISNKTMANRTFQGSKGGLRRRSECNPFDDPNKKQLKVYSDETLEKDYEKISNDYEEKYLNAGFPPKICQLMVTTLCSQSKLNCTILDVGCGKGCLGEYLR